MAGTQIQIAYVRAIIATDELNNPLTAEWALRALIDFTLSNARRFYSSMVNPLDGKGLNLALDSWKAEATKKWILIIVKSRGNLWIEDLCVLEKNETDLTLIPARANGLKNPLSLSLCIHSI